MALVAALAEWFNVRPHELRRLGLAVACAFLVLTFVVLARSLREAFFLTVFDIRRLPWMTGAVVAAGLPAVDRFSRMLTMADPHHVVRTFALALAAGILPLSPFLPHSRIAVVVFYLWTAVGTLLVSSGFWVVVSEQFPLRGAKRLFGLIGAGGTVGAMTTGISLSWLTGRVSLTSLVLAAAVVPALFAAMLSVLSREDPHSDVPPAPTDTARRQDPRLPLWQSARLVWATHHLRVIALVIFSATLITTLVDFQFKDLARLRFADNVDLVSFFGALYGWAGLAALLLQVVVTGRVLARTRLGVVIGFSPVLMIAGGVGLLAGAGLVLATAVRGVDYTLRKALYRPTIETLFLPVPPLLRRKTKTFIDTIVDASAEGCGALVILLWVSAAGLPASGLSLIVVTAAGALLYLGWSADRQYLQTVANRLHEEERRTRAALDTIQLPARDLLSATFTNLDLGPARADTRLAPEPRTEESGAGTADSEERLLEDLQSTDDAIVLRALDRVDALNPARTAIIERLLARDALFEPVLSVLERFPEDSVPPAIAALLDQEVEFVIRRRIPHLLARMGGAEADAALLRALSDRRFEVRYRAASAMVIRRRRGLPEATGNWQRDVWEAVGREVRRDRALWELQNLLDKHTLDVDDLVALRVGMRGELSLEHTFRLLTLVLEPDRVRAAYHGVILDDANLKSLALEYLEQVLPGSIRHRLWLFIGDVSEKRKAVLLRPLDAVVEELMATSMTLFGGDASRLALQKMLEASDDQGQPGEDRS